MKTRSLKIMRVLLKLFYSSRCLFHIFKVCVSKVTLTENKCSVSSFLWCCNIKPHSGQWVREWGIWSVRLHIQPLHCDELLTQTADGER